MNIFKYLTHSLLTACCVFLLVSCNKDKDKAIDRETTLSKLGKCQPVTLSGGLRKLSEVDFEYKSAGGTLVKIHSGKRGLSVISMTFMAFPDHFATVEFWGGEGAEQGAALHENFNGKHIKNRIGRSRTVIFPDGLKVTCVASGPLGAVTAISIYDGIATSHFNVSCNTWEYSASDGVLAKQLDESQADGETSMFENNGTELFYYNSYTEDTPGNKVSGRVNLGGLIKGSPKLINDFYDDPRINHT